MSTVLERKDSNQTQASSASVTTVTDKLASVSIKEDQMALGNKENNSKVVSN